MANCILCGQKVGLLDRKNFMFHGTVQTLCIGCTARLDSAAPQEREELFRQMLDSPDLEDGERIRADLNTGRHCPACGGMLERRLRNFSIGADGYGGLTSLGWNSLRWTCMSAPSAAEWSCMPPSMKYPSGRSRTTR